MTGLRAVKLPRNAKLATASRMLEAAVTFSDRSPGEPFWYENSNGLLKTQLIRDARIAILGLRLVFRWRSSRE